MTQTKTKTTRIQETNRGIILDAALEVFSAYGFRGSTIDQIAEKAGMSKPNLLYYFPRKEDIYINVLEKTLDEWLTPFRHIDPKGDPLDELAKYIVAKLKLSESRPESSRVFANEILHGAPAIGDFLQSHLRNIVDRKVGVIRTWIDDGRLAPIDPHHLIFMIWATTQHYADFKVQIGAVVPDRVKDKNFYEETAASIITILFNGIRPRQEY